MLRIANMEELDRLQLQVPHLIDDSRALSPGFVADVRTWLASVERSLEANRLPAAGLIATMRGRLLSAERGLLPSELQFRGRPTRRKVLACVASEALKDATALLDQTVANDRLRVSEGMLHCRRLVAHPKAKQLVRGPRPKGNLTGWLKSSWQALSVDPALIELAVHIEGLLGPTDVLVALDRSLGAGG